MIRTADSAVSHSSGNSFHWMLKIRSELQNLYVDIIRSSKYPRPLSKNFSVVLPSNSNLVIRKYGGVPAPQTSCCNCYEGWHFFLKLLSMHVITWVRNFPEVNSVRNEISDTSIVVPVVCWKSVIVTLEWSTSQSDEDELSRILIRFASPKFIRHM
jgi:hypothetical protein